MHFHEDCIFNKFSLEMTTDYAIFVVHILKGPLGLWIFIALQNRIRVNGELKTSKGQVWKRFLNRIYRLSPSGMLSVPNLPSMAGYEKFDLYGRDLRRFHTEILCPNLTIYMCVKTSNDWFVFFKLHLLLSSPQVLNTSKELLSLVFPAAITVWLICSHCLCPGTQESAHLNNILSNHIWW